MNKTCHTNTKNNQQTCLMADNHAPDHDDPDDENGLLGAKERFATYIKLDRLGRSGGNF